jgi:biotin-[acetyl-CoA-carboxylase] ligase BirA-like protein
MFQKFIHHRLHHCESTQNEIRKYLTEDSPFHLVSTLEQTLGRGRRERVWENTPKSLLFSFSATPHPQLTWQALEVAVVVKNFIEEKFLKKLSLKWPNDLYFENQKIAGILIHHLSPYVIVGIGLNIVKNSHWHGLFPNESDVSLDLHECASEFVNFYHSNRQYDLNFLKKSWLDSCAHLHKEVTIQEGLQIFEGIFFDLGEYGGACLKNDSGLSKEILNGTLRLKIIS